VKANKPAKNNGNDKFAPGKDIKVEELIKKAIEAHDEKQRIEREGTLENIKILNDNIKEFLKSFIVIGYTFEGQPINMVFAHNQQEADSLATCIKRYLNRSIMAEEMDDEDMLDEDL